MKKKFKKVVKILLKHQKKILIALAVILVVALTKVVFFPPCVPATQANYMEAFFVCLSDLNSDENYARACKEIRNEKPGCKFEQKDEKALEKFSKDVFQTCVESLFNAVNICTDKVKETFQL